MRLATYRQGGAEKIGVVDAARTRVFDLAAGAARAGATLAPFASMLALIDATAPLGTGETTVASGSVRLVDQATDVPPPPSPGLPLPPLPQGIALSPELQQEISQMYTQGQQMLAAGPPPNVPNEVCRYNTVRVPCPPA